MSEIPEHHRLDEVKRYLDLVKDRCLRAGVLPDGITYRGVSIQEFTREELWIMLADKVRQVNQRMEEDILTMPDEMRRQIMEGER